MRPIKVSLTGVGTHVIPVDRYRHRMTIQADVTGTATWNVKWTADNVYREQGPYQWNDHPDGAIGGTADGSAFIDFPVFALLLEITDGTGTVELTILQAKFEV